MKKIIVVLLMIIIIPSLLVGCSNNNGKTKKDKETVTQKSKYDSIDFDQSIKFEVETKTYTSDINSEGIDIPTVIIEYPSIRLFDNEEIEQKINNEIETLILSDLDTNKEFYQRTNICFSVTYDWSNHGSVFSIKFMAEEIIDGAVVGSPRFTLNYDLTDGERIKLSEIYSVDKKFKDYIFDESIFLVGQDVARDAFMKEYGDNLLNELSNADKAFYNDYNGVKQPIYSYYGKDSLILFVYHGHRAASGGYYNIKIPYEKIEQFRKN